MLTGVDVGSIGDNEIDDNDQLVFDPPCVRTRHAGTQYAGGLDNQQLNYNASHIFEVWCVAENLRSKEEQRGDTETLLGTVIQQLAGARLVLTDGSESEPIRLVDVRDFPQDLVGLIYILRVAVPGIAQFPRTNSEGPPAPAVPWIPGWQPYTPAGVIDGVNCTFTLPRVPGAALQIFRNGQLLAPDGDFVLEGAVFLMILAPKPGDVLVAYF